MIDKQKSDLLTVITVHQQVLNVLIAILANKMTGYSDTFSMLKEFLGDANKLLKELTNK